MDDTIKQLLDDKKELQKQMLYISMRYDNLAIFVHKPEIDKLKQRIHEFENNILPDIKPCPFCGTQGTLNMCWTKFDGFEKNQEGWKTHCNLMNCLAWDHSGPRHLTKKLAIEEWNRRASDAK